jgi:hypothetical protein
MLSEEEEMDRAGTEKLPAPGAKVSGVKNMQRSLSNIGMPVKLTGVIDQPTVEALNAVFQGWDDAPARLRTGTLTAREIQSMLPAVQHYLHKAIGEAKDFGDAAREG